jgi:hypothetical protein
MMGRGSTNKKVARAASTGGGRTARGRTPWLWYGGITAVVVVGVLLVASSRNSLDPTIEHPDFNDHWHTAYGIYICDQFKPPMPQPSKLLGLHTHTDGLIHVEPNVTASVNDTGRNANVGRWESGQPGFKISKTRLQYPGDKTYKNGDKCGSKPAKVKVLVWSDENDDTPEDATDDPHAIRVRDLQLVTFAFVPEGTDIPKPPSVANLADPNAGETGQAPNTATTAAAPTATTVPGATTAPPAAPTSAPQ